MPKTETKTKPKASVETLDNGTIVITEEIEAPDAPVDDGMTHIEWRGATFVVPQDQNKWPIRTMQKFSRRQHVDAVEILFGPMQFDLLMSRGQEHPGELTTEEFWEFFPVLAEAVGFTKADDEKSKD
jgi:hypothetical protein